MGPVRDFLDFWVGQNRLHATFSTGQTSGRQVVLAAVQQNGSVGPRDREIFVAPCNVCYRDVHGNLVFSN